MKELSLESDSRKVLVHLADLLDVGTEAATVRSNAKLGSSEADMVVDFGGLVFVVEIKKKGDAASVGQAIRHVLSGADALGSKALPLVVVPYMGDVGRKLCGEARVSWLDLSGNASLSGRPGLRIQIEGKPNRFKSPGRPQNLFAPKSARITRRLLMSPDTALTQRELAEQSGLDEGFTSRIVREMESQDLLIRDHKGAVRASNPRLLLEAWREAYDFNKHQITKGHVAARSGTELINTVARQMEAHGLIYAATGLAGAWLINPFAGYRLAILYHDESLPDKLIKELNFREESRGANLWLVRPNDSGVFQGSQERSKVQCVHPVQVYVDLKQHPERADEASEALLEMLFPHDQARMESNL
ncbi:type IV toxin-antitoxin system AbiEi family antitoxin [Cerasicoccus fimbriatus]|uniref:type IV toxin-antitoxin system AbiEi family antitoxin n=1 Tax=Cerasicoccus fimbriatus TaxID=3014554 RepID=UPI0022B2BAB8|nr:type IV toxin-antitoxin system AbiEi family antitoxin [Cerasicoccus sp. TK19100]